MTEQVTTTAIGSTAKLVVINQSAERSRLGG